ncbi:hypothetical protein E2C01_059725 [Portunus trituberculatus]|uniref:Uncharacterized protein n=1 Tax=Portunus trituberculatus TaxID=210409 RepID=A0A5B7H8K7_PORTR|nr:hypothetical protein [Portunus trituberculatus]
MDEGGQWVREGKSCESGLRSPPAWITGTLDSVAPSTSCVKLRLHYGRTHTHTQKHSPLLFINCES